jgi:hypothetical protein
MLIFKHASKQNPLKRLIKSDGKIQITFSSGKAIKRE